MPGVGAFRHGMEKLKEKDLDLILDDYIQTNKPLLGICLGMQLAVIEIARNLMNLSEANSTEFKRTNTPIVSLMTEWINNE